MSDELKVSNSDESWCRINSVIAEELRQDLPMEEDVQDSATLFKVLGDPTRLNILNVLSREPLCVCDLSSLLEMSQTAVSHQLKVLRHNRLVTFRKEGKMAVYSLVDEHVLQLMNIATKHVREVYR